MSIQQLESSAKLLLIAASTLDQESHNVDLNFRQKQFLNVLYKETKQLELELRAFMGHFPVDKIQEVGVIEKLPSLKLLEIIAKKKMLVCEKDIK